MVKLVEDGFIRVQTDTDTGYRIYNYAEKTVFEGLWIPETIIARGLILDHHGYVVARPFPKFFNYGESNSPVLHPDMQVEATDKMDGSLGIIYKTPDNEVKVATRGSFASDQAVHATRVLNEKYPEWVQNTKNATPHLVTPLVEIIYPENRIVCDYEGVDDLVLLGWIYNPTGTYYSPDLGFWDGPRTEVFPYKTVAEALAAPPREGKEGLVLYIPEISDWVKVKQADYVELHRIVTGLSARRVYEALRSGQTPEDICAPLPDEFHGFVKEVAFKLYLDVVTVQIEAYETHDEICDALELEDIQQSDKDFRKEFAMRAKNYKHPALLFSILDDRTINDKIWKMFEPSADWTPATHGRLKDV
jgi:RNA ligase